MADSASAATWITLLLIGVFALCFLVNLFTIKISKEIEEFVITTENNKKDNKV
jgi:hypothetical protein